MKRFLSFNLILIGLMLGTVMVSSARSSWTIYQQNRLQQGIRLPDFPAPEEPQRLLIVSPHPDDETLGCGGLIRQARERGIPVTVAIVTNGDAFPNAVRQTYRKLRLQPDDYLRFGKLRQGETWKAMERLGVPKNRVVFLGYPDRGLAPMWQANFEPGHPFTSSTTRRSANPYPLTFHPGAAYYGASLVDDLSKLIHDVQPTDLFFTHPNDDHPDHAYLSCYIVAALDRLRANETGARPVDPRFASFSAPSNGIRLHTFLIHRGDWPAPQGYRPNEHLPPPKALAQLDTHWRALDLTPGEIEAKSKALNAYSSQLHAPPGPRFLNSFVRRNELFGEYRFLLGDDPHQWGPEYSTPWYLTLDPLNDKVSRNFQPGADLEEIGVSRKQGHLQIRVETRGRLSRWVQYRVYVHRLDAEDPRQPSTFNLVLTPRKAPKNPAFACTWSDDTVETDLPLKALGNPRRVMVSADTVMGGMVVDRAAWRAFDLE